MVQANLVDLASPLARFFNSIAAGNEGYAEVEELNWDSGSLVFNVKIRHHQVFSENIAGKHVMFSVYDVTTYIQGKIDPLNLKDGEIKFCVDSPVGKLCITLKAILQFIVDFLKKERILV
jgi:uncharacterized protein YpmS